MEKERLSNGVKQDFIWKLHLLQMFKWKVTIMVEFSKENQVITLLVEIDDLKMILWLWYLKSKFQFKFRLPFSLPYTFLFYFYKLSKHCFCLESSGHQKRKSLDQEPCQS